MNFVLIHGAWHGGWCWRDVSMSLRATGHQVWAPTMTGLGERAHLLTSDTSLSTFVDDSCAVLECEELNDVVLVGHSFGGPVISGVADRMPERLRHLIYLDALIVQNGESALGILPPDVQKERSRTIDPQGLRMAIPTADKFGITEPVQVDWLQRRLTPHPLNAYREVLRLRNPIGNGVPCTYIAAANPWYVPGTSSRAWVRSQADWGWREIDAGHDAMVSAPRALASMLMEIADAC